MKKLGIFAVLLSVALFVGCPGKTEKKEPVAPETPTATTPEAPAGDETTPADANEEATLPAGIDEVE